MTGIYEYRVLSSMAKVFLDEAPEASNYVGKESVFKGETYAFQIAYKAIWADPNGYVKQNPVIKIDGPYKDNVTVKIVECVPCEMTAYAHIDEGYIRDAKPGLYPDVIKDIEKESVVKCTNTVWRNLWIEFTPDENTKVGTNDIIVQFSDIYGEIFDVVNVPVKVIDKVLPEHNMKITQWFHADCISEYYGVESLSDEHFDLIEKFVKTFVRNGNNMLLVPLFTPPLDIAVGGERPTIQLIKVIKENGKYSFNLDNLERYISIALRCGIKYFEMSHLFTQWGAEFTPKIFATVDGEIKKIFGWEVSSTSDEYKEFLAAFIPVLTSYLEEKGLKEITYFHISDEPHLNHLENYKACMNILKPLIKGFKTFDALSNLEFYNEGLVEIPVPASTEIEAFLDKDLKERWVYYCCGQALNVSNRFIAMSGAANRIIGSQFFKFDIEGFLQWGFNFYYLQFSKGLINPYMVTDAGFGFPSGDAFSVYPGKNGPEESTRIRVFYQALCDLRAMKLLAELKGKQYVLDIMEDSIDPITFSHAPRNEDYILKTRIRINNEIEKALGL